MFAFHPFPLLASSLAVLLCAPISAQVTQRVSLGAGGVPGDARSDLGFRGSRSISADGRFVAFESEASNLVPGDTNHAWDVFVRDRQNGTIERVSVDSGGAQADADSLDPSLSADGRYVVFTSLASNLVHGDTNREYDAFVHDRVTGTTERISVDSNGVQGDRESDAFCISDDGRIVAFISLATHLVPGDTNGRPDVFVRDRQTRTTERVNVSSTGAQAATDVDDWSCSLSADGRFVAFVSSADNLVAGDTNVCTDVFVHDRRTGTTERVSVTSNGAQQTHNFWHPNQTCCLSADGRFVAFNSRAADLVTGDTNGTWDVFVHDRTTGVTERASVDSNGVEANHGGVCPSISADGRYVAFLSPSANLAPGDTNGVDDAFVHDRATGTTECVSLRSSGAIGNGETWWIPVLSADGRYVAMSSEATNLVPGDTNGFEDVFVRDRFGGTAFTSVCDPGAASVIGCPCANPPSGSGRGCDNSSATGGASLSASGGTFLSSDSLVLATRGERPDALSIVMQGNAVIASGVVYGQGVGCLGGTVVLRLYTKPAVGGSIRVPDFGLAEPSVSARSAALGDAIQVGQRRAYLVLYRDGIVLGGCPSTSTFNATQTGIVSWAP